MGGVGVAATGPDRELTARQREFVRLVVSGESPSLSDAYRRSHDSSGSPSTVRTAASRLWRAPHVKAAVDAARLQAERDEGRRRLGERERVRRALWYEAEHADRAGDRIAALRLLAQASAMLVDRVEVESQEQAPAEMVEELRQLLESTATPPEVDKKLH